MQTPFIFTPTQTYVFYGITCPSLIRKEPDTALHLLKQHPSLRPWVQLLHLPKMMLNDIAICVTKNTFPNDTAEYKHSLLVSVTLTCQFQPNTFSSMCAFVSGRIWVYSLWMSLTSYNV